MLALDSSCARRLDGIMARAVPLYDRKVVNSAASEYVAGRLEGDALDDALHIVNNWRSAHSFPLNTFAVRLKSKARDLDPTALVAQRIKRLPSIAHKIERFPRVTLTQMQDIGGCRAVLANSQQVTRIVAEGYEGNNDLRHTLVRKDDYISSPRDSGYRGVHLIWKYKSDRNEVYNDLKVEMQLRSSPQHAWATAVETTGTFIQQALKSS